MGKLTVYQPSGSVYVCRGCGVFVGVSEGGYVGVGVNVGCAVCVPTTAVLTSASAVSMAMVGSVFGQNCGPIHDEISIAARKIVMNILLIGFKISVPSYNSFSDFILPR